ncbi:MAG: hypothetical protein ACP5FK_06115 [bacterium]
MLSKKLLLGAGLVVLTCISALSLNAEKIEYTAAEIEIWVPSDWEYELYGTQMIINHTEADVVLSFNAIEDEDGNSLDEELFEIMVEAAVDELEVQSEGVVELEEEVFQDEIDGMPVFGAAGLLDTDEDDYVVFIASFQRSSDNIVFLIVLANEDDMDEYGDVVEAILDSIDEI